MARPQTLVDIIIVNYKSTPQLCDCLASIQRHLAGLHPRIYVEDNSLDNSVDIITEKFPQVRVRKNTRNLGFAAAVNQSLAEGQSPFVMLLNPDSEVLADFLSPALELMAQIPRMGALGPRIFDHDGITIQESARTFPNMLTGLFGRTSLLSKRFPRNRFTQANLLAASAKDGKPVWVDWVSGACMIVRRETCSQIGGLDERFFMYWEDADWCRRMWQSGWKVAHYPLRAVRHSVGASSRQLRFRSSLAFHRSVFLLYRKYTPRSICWTPFVLTLLCGRLILSLSTQYLEQMRRSSEPV